MEENPSRALLLLFEQYTPQTCLSRTLFKNFKQNKTPAVPYFSILNRLKLQPNLFFAF